VHNRAKFRGDRSNLSEMRFFDLSIMAAVCHLGFVIGVFGAAMKGIWWSLSLRKIWLESIQ